MEIPRIVNWLTVLYGCIVIGVITCMYFAVRDRPTPQNSDETNHKHLLELQVSKSGIKARNIVEGSG